MLLQARLQRCPQHALPSKGIPRPARNRIQLARHALHMLAYGVHFTRIRSRQQVSGTHQHRPHIIVQLCSSLCTDGGHTSLGCGTRVTLLHTLTLTRTLAVAHLHLGLHLHPGLRLGLHLHLCTLILTLTLNVTLIHVHVPVPVPVNTTVAVCTSVATFRAGQPVQVGRRVAHRVRSPQPSPQATPHSCWHAVRGVRVCAEQQPDKPPEQ